MKILIGIFLLLFSTLVHATTVKEANQYLNEMRSEFAKYKTKGRFIQAVALKDNALIKKYDLYNSKINLKAPMPNLFVADNRAWLVDSSGRTNLVKVLALDPLVLTLDGQRHIYRENKNTNKKSAAMNWLGMQSAYGDDASLTGGAVLLGLAEMGAIAKDVYTSSGDRRQSGKYLQRRSAMESLTSSSDWQKVAAEGQIAIDLFNYFDKLNCTAESTQVGETDNLKFLLKVENGVSLLQAVDKKSGQKLEIRTADIAGRKENVYLVCAMENKCEEYNKDEFHGMLDKSKVLALENIAGSRTALTDKLEKLLKTALENVKDQRKKNQNFVCAPRPTSKQPLTPIAKVREGILKDQDLIARAYAKYRMIFQELSAHGTTRDRWLKFPWNPSDKDQFKKVLAERLLRERPEAEDIENESINAAALSLEYYDFEKYRPIDLTDAPKGTKLAEYLSLTEDEEDAYREMCQSQSIDRKFAFEQFKTVATEIDRSVLDTKERQTLLSIARNALDLPFDSINECKEYKTEKSWSHVSRGPIKCFENVSCGVGSGRRHRFEDMPLTYLSVEAFNECLTHLNREVERERSNNLRNVLETVSSTATCCGSSVCKESFAKLQTLRRGLDKSSGKATQTQ